MTSHNVGHNEAESSEGCSISHDSEASERKKEFREATINAVNEAFAFFKEEVEGLQEQVEEVNSLREEVNELRSFRDWAEPLLMDLDIFRRRTEKKFKRLHDNGKDQKGKPVLESLTLPISKHRATCCHNEKKTVKKPSTSNEMTGK